MLQKKKKEWARAKKITSAWETIDRNDIINSKWK